MDRTFTARLDCHYLLRPPEKPGARAALVVALHGFGQTAETMLELTARLFDPRHAIASIQGPYQFYLRDEARTVGYCWNTGRRPHESIRLHHDMARHVLQEAGQELAIPVERRILVGFSQPVSLNYRFAATFPDRIAGVVGICGGLPSDWESAPYHQVTAPVLHIARREDEFYPPAVTEQYPGRLRLRVKDVEFQLLDGGHRMPSKGRGIVEGWLERILR
jgi:predicted esterase